ncbi:uncharacterized protein LOC130675527 [Microplitis mediator]|uniref:uncharacterized protein LOC130675527 n=1 Tax=Microplitis mediator TaxID=375433 RepID=UPI002556A4FF|nr:uncharacterized protein LOC130675527 [Microplitis mediator]
MIAIKWFILLGVIIIMITVFVIYFVKPFQQNGGSERGNLHERETTNLNEPSKQKDVAVVPKEPNPNHPAPGTNPDEPEIIKPAANTNLGPTKPAEVKPADVQTGPNPNHPAPGTDPDEPEIVKPAANTNPDPTKPAEVKPADVQTGPNSDHRAPGTNPDEPEIVKPAANTNAGSTKPAEVKPADVQTGPNSDHRAPGTNPDEPEIVKPAANTNAGSTKPAEVKPADVQTGPNPNHQAPGTNPDEPEIIKPAANTNPNPTKPAEVIPDIEEESKLPEVNDIEDDKTSRKQKLRRALKNDLTLENGYETIVTGMDEDKDTTFLENFTDSDDVMTMKINEASLFGIALLYKYASDNTLTKYLGVVEFLIEHIDEELPKDKIENYQTTIWDFDWYDITVSFARMLSMYECLGETEAVLKICHRRLTEMGPKLGEGTGRAPEGVDLVHVMIPRLITDYLNDTAVYKADIRTDIFTRFREVFHATNKTVDNGKDGLYRDGSYVCQKVATFSNLAKLGSFYINMYRAMVCSTEINGVVVKLFDKILHPDMDFVPYGLFGREPKITCTDILKLYWPDYKRNATLGVNIFPYIGLGVFKSPNFVFSLRVQRPDFAAYESDPDNFEFPAGWIQMRKLYLKGVDYSKYKNEMKWPELKLQPGVISFVDNKYNKFENLKPVTGSLAHLCQEVKSYIGYLTDDDKNLLFWINSYKFDKIYGDSEVMEYGICTDNGLVMRYSVDKIIAGRELKLRVKDDDTKDDSRMHIETSENLDANGCFALSSAKDYYWRQVFDTSVEPTEIVKNSKESISFTFNKKHYRVDSIDDCYYTVKCEDNIKLVGSSRSNPNDVYTSNGTTFKRNLNTMMYEVTV